MALARTETTYKTCGCGADCYVRALDVEESRGLCWGNVSAIDEVGLADEDYGWVHACEGHSDTYDGGEYIAPK